MTISLTLAQILWGAGGLVQLVAMIFIFRYTGFLANRPAWRAAWVVLWPLGLLMLWLIARVGVVQ